MRKNSHIATLVLAALLLGCSPHFNWREFTSKDASYQVLFPDKPSTASRIVDLDGTRTNMTMTAAEVDDIVFLVGQVEASDTAAASSALAAMQTGLLRNIQGTTTRAASSTATNSAGTRVSRDIDATGQRNGKPVRLVAHFEARGRSLYQVVVVGPADAVKSEQTEQFISSFKVMQ